MKSKTKLLRGIVDPDDYSDDELVTMSLRMPATLAQNLNQAAAKFSPMIGGSEAFILTALAYSLCCIDEQERRLLKKKRPPKKK